MWALPLPLPTIAYVVRPVGDGPFPLAIMNHGVSLDPVQRSFFPLVEFRDAAMWFARRGYMVVAPSGSGYGAAAVEVAEAGLFSGVFFSKVGKCSNPNFRDAGLAVAKLNLWIIDYMSTLKRIVPNNVIVVGQSAGGWASIALSSVNPPPVKAIITFAAGRGGRVDGKPNNNCAPDKLVEATGEFGRTSRVPMLWMYIENDTYFGPELSKRMHAAFTAAGGKAEYHLFPPHGGDGHFFVGRGGRRTDLVAAGRRLPRQAQVRSDANIHHGFGLVFGVAVVLSAADAGLRTARRHPRRPKRPRTNSPRAASARPAASNMATGRKLCFKPGGAKMVCRTTISGTFETGQTAVRIYLTEREGDSAARLQLFLPVGLYVPPGVKLTVDKGTAHKIPFTWCLTNTCIAGDLANPALLREMETGKNLTVEVVDTNLLAVTTSLPLRPVRRRPQGCAGAGLRTEDRRVTRDLPDAYARAAALSIGSISDCAVNGLVR